MIISHIECTNEKSSRHLVAVYGSLLSGLGNHSVMERAEGSFYASGYIENFALYPYAGTSYPCITQHKGSQVTVEVYSVDDAGLEQLDWLEGYPSFYDRMQVNTYGAGGDADADNVWVYFHIEKPDMDLIEHGDWKRYLDEQVN